MTDAPVTDPESGLFSEAMLRAVLPSRVATARRTLRQLGLVVAAVGDGPDPGEMAELVGHTVRDSDIAARLDDGRVALVLEFTPSEGCAVVADRFRTKVAETHPDAEVRLGIACYPAHALSADELVVAADTALGEAGPGDVVTAPVAE
ncbi:diguanylate cyclase [Iamia majanohamensis]|uniref:Diguanylate cyclase n=1 Tax=Iamia majanohamensis TaxID=467976 RepID=A0AAE9YA08_9ACTN|nr:diguanylate cyclase [Iamia majanohamensis]WCO67393.1 diguanylate cyclase [Iamia majanohamensis]